MSDFTDALPDVDTILSIAPDELAGYLLAFFHSIPQKDHQLRCMREEWILGIDAIRDFPQRTGDVAIALATAYNWLLKEGLIIKCPVRVKRELPFREVTHVFSRQGELLKRREDFEELRKRSALPKEILHPVIREKAWPHLLRGEYDTAIFQACKEVEVAVRSAGQFELDDIGTKLMWDAFRKNSGKLIDASEPESEQDALGYLFAGAIGRFKNPGSHRHVGFTDAAETFEVLALASLLMRFVDDRKGKRTGA